MPLFSTSSDARDEKVLAQVPNSSEARQDDLRNALAAAGLRWTAQREEVFSALCDGEPGHPTAEQVFLRVRHRLPKISLATVYKALDALEASGKVTRLASPDGSARFDARADHHYHVRSLKSGRVHDLPTPYDPDLLRKLDPGLVDRLRRDGFRLVGYRLELVGYFDGEEAS